MDAALGMVVAVALMGLVALVLFAFAKCIEIMSKDDSGDSPEQEGDRGQAPHTVVRSPEKGAGFGARVVGLWSFSGRIPRHQWWLRMVGFFVGMLLAFMFGTVDEGGIWFIVALYVVVQWGIFATHAKRWHDLGKSGWWSLVLLIPIIGAIGILCALGFQNSEDGENKYGPGP